MSALVYLPAVTHLGWQVDLTVELESDTSYEEITAEVKLASETCAPTAHAALSLLHLRQLTATKAAARTDSMNHVPRDANTSGCTFRTSPHLATPNLLTLNR